MKLAGSRSSFVKEVPRNEAEDLFPIGMKVIKLTELISLNVRYCWAV